MPRRFALASVCALIGMVGGVVWLRNSAVPEPIFEVNSAPVPVAPLCPWRNPEGDLEQLFPGASGYTRETRILSGLRTELAHVLGRRPTAEENALQVYRIFRGKDVVGTITTRRVKGRFGAMELVIASDARGRIAGWLLQRSREPAAIAEAIQSISWRERFAGRDVNSSWDSEELLAGLPEPARMSAGAIVEGVRTAGILLAASERDSSRPLAEAHNH